MSVVSHCYRNQWSNHIWNTQILCGVHSNKVISNLLNFFQKATKLVINFKNTPYKERSVQLKRPELKYRRLRGDMTDGV